MKQTPPILEEIVSAGQCVAYVGAGFSVPCGMPTWYGLLEKLICHAEANHVHSLVSSEKLESAKKMLSEGRLVVVSTILRSLISPPEINRIVEGEFNISVFHNSSEVGKQIISNRIVKLISTNFAGIITTNYDTLIEHGITNQATFHYKQCAVNSDELGDILSVTKSNSRFFVKVHGSITGGGFVLSTEDYNKTYFSNNAVRYFLISAMLRYQFLFVGCSLEDDLVEIRRELCQTYSKNIPLAYAILPDSPFNRARSQWLFDHAMIQCILMKPKKAGRVIARHDYVDKVLNQLAESNEPALAINPKTSGEIAEILGSLDKDARINSVGDKNREIVNLIAGRRKVSHDTVESLMSKEPTNKLVRVMDLEEIYYRIQFLVSVNLIFESRDATGRLFYSSVPLK